MMLDEMKEDEIIELIKELKEAGYDFDGITKGTLLKQEAEKLGMANCYISSTLKTPILTIADWATNNYEYRYRVGTKQRFKRQTVSSDISKEYREVCSGILKAIQRYYGRSTDFRGRQEKMKDEG